MPSSWLNVPHFRQELDASCVAACVRAVLSGLDAGDRVLLHPSDRVREGIRFVERTAVPGA